jgi:hypothetical protein
VSGAVGEASAWFVSQPMWPELRIWHFSRHPQPFVTSLIRFGFWGLNNVSIHHHLRHTRDEVADSFSYWVDWNRRILDIETDHRTTFRIEDICDDLIDRLAQTVGRTSTSMRPAWNERQEFAQIPEVVRGETVAMMQELGYA